VFLSREAILNRLESGDLVVEPLLAEEQVGPFAIDLRIGTEFVRLATQIGALPDPVRNLGEVETIDLGRHIVLEPGKSVLASSLEYIGLPQDLGALLFPRTSLMRAGLLGNTSSVEPGFQGKLLLSFFNAGATPVLLSPGFRAVRLTVFPVAVADQRYERYVGVFGPDVEIQALRDTLAAEDRDLQSTLTPHSGPGLEDYFVQVNSATGVEKGKALERFTAAFIRTINGLEIIKTNALLSAEEIDIYVENHIGTGFWRLAGSPMIVECKNWSTTVGAREISVLHEKLVAISPDAKTAILVAPDGVSGDEYRNAVLKIRESRQRGKQIIVLEREDLEAIAHGEHGARVIENKYRKLILI
jgi:dCTP deaminase